MSNSTIYRDSHFDQDQEVWGSLKEAIAKSSGFQCWLQEKTLTNAEISTKLDDQVRCYLRETLETLAY